MSKYDVTVLYYSGNTEDPIFEAHIRENILKNKGDLPLVSVTQEPLPDFGQNIYVGRHDANYTNEFRQIQIGLNAITTPYVLVAESDCLYPPEYFQFQPPELGKIYRYANVWVHFYLDPGKRNPKFYYKKYSDGSQCFDKNVYLDLINKALEGRKDWTEPGDPPHQGFATRSDDNCSWTSENPVITFKTRQGLSHYTQYQKNVPPVGSLPFWGSAVDLRKELFS
jgi:hypothetical protein